MMSEELLKLVERMAQARTEAWLREAFDPKRRQLLRLLIHGDPNWEPTDSSHHESGEK